jgi:membrane protein
LTNVSFHPESLFRRFRQFAEGLRAHNAFEAAAAIAFWFFLSLLPLLVLLGFLVGLVARSRGVDALLTPLLDVVPGAADDIFRHELERMAGSTGSVAPLGVIGFLWTASSGLHNLMDVFESAAKVEPRAWWQQRVIALGWVLLGLATACLSAWTLVKVDSALYPNEPVSSSIGAFAAPPAATPANPWALSPSSSRAQDRLASRSSPGPSRQRGALTHRFSKALHTPTEQLIATALMLVVGMTLLAGFYRYAVEHPTGVRRRVWPGTFTAVASWLIVSWGFGLYAVSMSSYALYYGSLAAVAVLLVWLYLTSLSLVVGAEVNAQLEGVQDTGPRKVDPRRGLR